MDQIPAETIALLELGGWLDSSRSLRPDATQEAFERFSASLGGVTLEAAGRLANRRICGTSDQIGTGLLGAAQCKWSKRDLTYSVAINKETGGVPVSGWKTAVRLACDQWEAACGIQWTETANGGDLLIQAGTRRPLGTVGGVLAWCELPCGGSDTQLRMEIDAREPWSTYGSKYIVGVIAHELGHGLGLGHSNSSADLMFPYMGAVFAVAKGDAAFLTPIYGPPRNRPQPTPTPDPTPIPNSPLFVIHPDPGTLVETSYTTKGNRILIRSIQSQ